MPRALRVTHAHVVYHVLNRADERRRYWRVSIDGQGQAPEMVPDPFLELTTSRL